MNVRQEDHASDIDRHFANFIARFGGDLNLVSLAATMLSRSIREKNICLPLDEPSADAFDVEKTDLSKWPDAKEWREAFANSKAIGRPEETTPIVLDDSNRLYLRRYWNYQQRLASALLSNADRNRSKIGRNDGTQAAAVNAAINNSLTIISGGPGTGKTSTVIQILARLLAETGSKQPRVALVAPTGKAAVRLEETIRAGLDAHKYPDELKTRLPKSASTIHRLLGSKGSSVYFRHDQHHPLPIDLLVIDEASMVSLPLLCKVFDALPTHCRVILLGDHEQLASVEPGAVLADIVDAAAGGTGPLSHAVVTLKKNYRFREQSGVYHLCNVVRQGDADSAIRILREQSHLDLVSGEERDIRKSTTAFSKVVLSGFSSFFTEKEPAAALSKVEGFRILTALRHGPFGVDGLNRAVERVLSEAELIPAQLDYAGKPILIMKNDYPLQLFNGDIGILLPDPTTNNNPNELWAWFTGKEKIPRRFAPARLPEYQTAYAITVHKSQGSEFDRVLFILPEEDSPVLTRELIYTGLTRARSQVELWWNADVLTKAVTRRAERHSRLRELLASPPPRDNKPRSEQLRLF